MKKIFILSLLAFLGFVPHVLAQFVPLAPIPGLTDPTALGSALDANTLANFFNNLYKYLIGLAATLAVIEIIWGGLEISTKDSVSKQSDGKERITQAIFGLVLVLSPVLVFSIINPSILNLSLNLPQIDLKVPVVSGGGGTGSTTPAEAAGCSVAFSNGDVGCPTQDAANAFAASCSNGLGRVFLSNQSALPYAASCNTLQPYQGNRNYTDKTQIPNGYWCYLTNVTVGSSAVLTYICGADENSCVALANSSAGGGSYAGGCRTAPF